MALRPIRMRTQLAGGSEKRHAVFFDRDGVLNASVVRSGLLTPPRSLDELVIVPEAAAQVGRVHDAGFLAIVVTNQPDVARGALASSVLHAINQQILDQLGLDDCYVCEHDTEQGCVCRKPSPGMLLSAADDWNLDLTGSWMVGDRWVDIAAGAAAGVQTVMLEHTASWARTSSGAPPPELAADHSALALDDCIDSIVTRDVAAREEEIGA